MSSIHLNLIQEGSRVLVLLCRHSNQQWGSMMASVLCAVEWVVQELHKRRTKCESEWVSGQAILIWSWWPSSWGPLLYTYSVANNSTLSKSYIKYLL